MRFIFRSCATLVLLISATQAAAQGVGTPVDSSLPGRTAPPAVRKSTSSRRIVGVFDEDSGLPIADADVVDLIGGAVAHTETHGLMELSQFHNQNDSAVVQVRKIGYADTSLIVMVGLADTVPLQINLHRAATALETMISNAASSLTLEGHQLQEFEERKQTGIGNFMDGPELRKYADNHSLVNYLASHFPSLSVTQKAKASDPTYLASGRGSCSGPAFKCGGSTTACLIATYIDGVALYVPGRGMTVPDLTDYRPEDFAAIEWYPGAGSVPAKYSTTGATCGVLLLWRKYS